MEYLCTGHNLYSYIDRPFLDQYLRECRPAPKGARTYQYSNVGVGLLAHLIEVKTGRSFPELVCEKLCRPLQLRDTGYALDVSQYARLVVGHAGDQPWFLRRGTPMPPWDMGEVMGPSGAMYSTPNDLMILAKANLGMLHHPLEPVLLSTHSVQVVTPAENVALGWNVDYFGQGRRAVIYKHGMVSGYTAYVGMDRQTGVAVIVLCGTFNWNDKIGHNLVLRLDNGLARTNDSD